MGQATLGVAIYSKCAASPQRTAWQHALSALSGIMHLKGNLKERLTTAYDWSAMDQGILFCDMERLMMARAQ